MSLFESQIKNMSLESNSFYGWLVATLVLGFCFFLQGCGQGDRGGISLEKEGSLSSADIVVSASSNSTSNSGESHLVSNIPKCLDIKSIDYLNDEDIAAVQSWDCLVGAPNQYWYFQESGEVVSENDKCLSLGDQFLDGVAVNLRECADSDDQKWSYDQYSQELKPLSMPGFCLDIFNNNIQQNGRVVAVWSCNGQANQRWSFQQLRASHLKNFFQDDLYINTQPPVAINKVKATPILSGWSSAKWVVEEISGNVRIRSAWKPIEFLNIENGALESSEILPLWLSAQWSLIPRPEVGVDAFQIRNAWKPTMYIGLDAEYQLRALPLAELIDGSDIWYISN